MKLILPLFLLFSTQIAVSQVTRWIIHINNRAVAKGSDSVLTVKPATIQIDSAQLPSETFLQIEITEPVSNIQWVRTFVFSTAIENPLVIKKFNRSNGKFSIPFDEILTKAGRENTVYLYTEQHPADPGSGIRSKKTLLAIMELK